MEAEVTPPINACLIIIGDEVLSGRTREANMQRLATWLEGLGIQLAEARVVPDEERAIITALNTCREQYTYVFTCGGIGPTHDDITTATIARAFGVPLVLDPRAVASLEAYYGAEGLNDARLKMAQVPKGGRLIENPVTGAPGFRLGNVFVMPGVPRIFEAMLELLTPRMLGGPARQSVTLRAMLRESDIATALAALQRQHSRVQIGSYPFMRDDEQGVALVLRSAEEDHLVQAKEAVAALLVAQGAELVEE